MKIINTDIVTAEQDIFWNNIPRIERLTVRPVLILSPAFEEQSTEADQLNSILKAGCKLNEEQYNIILLKDGEKLSWYRLREQLAPKIILLFNVLPAQLGISSLFRFNDINNFDKCLWVPTVSLQILIQDKTLKGQLWNNALKPLFDTKVHGDIVNFKS